MGAGKVTVQINTGGFKERKRSMSEIWKGYAHIYKRAHINTDEIIPARYLNTDDEAELARHAMEDIDPEFIRRVKPGDFVIASDDFGCGSSRAQTACRNKSSHSQQLRPHLFPQRH